MGFINHYVMYLLAMLAASLIGYKTSQLKKSLYDRKKRDEAIIDGMRALLRMDILAIYEKCKENGFCTIQDKDNVKNLYVPYSDLQGNGVISKLVTEILDMKTKEEH